MLCIRYVFLFVYILFVIDYRYSVCSFRIYILFVHVVHKCLNKRTNEEENRKHDTQGNHVLFN